VLAALKFILRYLSDGFEAKEIETEPPRNDPNDPREPRGINDQRESLGNGSGNGSGYGHGNGSGNGSGYGNGTGNGNGHSRSSSNTSSISVSSAASSTSSSSSPTSPSSSNSNSNSNSSSASDGTATTRPSENSAAAMVASARCSGLFQSGLLRGLLKPYNYVRRGQQRGEKQSMQVALLVNSVVKRLLDAGCTRELIVTTVSVFGNGCESCLLLLC
jgi:hypothetical protein